MSDVPPPPPPRPEDSGPASPPPVPSQPPPSPGYQVPPVAPSGSSNGMAVAALVLGILTFVCLGPIAGVLAIIFGVVGLGRAKTLGGNGRGMSIAGIVLGVVGSIVTVIVLIAVLVAAGNTADKIGNDIGGSAAASDYDLQAGTCEVDQTGFAEFKGTIKNTADEEKNFTIDVDFRNSSNNALIESSSDLVSDLAVGDTAEWSVTVLANGATSVSCKVTDVENFFN